MKSAILPLFALYFAATAQAAAPAAPRAESCEQIRAEIQAHTGMPARPNTALLGKVGANRQCRFTSAEAYRAAWGDKPMPKGEPRERRTKHREHDDD